MPPPQEDQPVILSDAGIRARIDSGAIRLDPYDPALVQPASIDFRLHQDILVFNNYTCEAIDPYAVPEDLHSKVTITDENPFILHPGDFVLASGRRSSYYIDARASPFPSTLWHAVRASPRSAG